MLVEFGELMHEIVRLRYFNAATEVADIHYYHAKLDGLARVVTYPLLLVANWLILSPLPLGGFLARVKYTERGRYGKDLAWEKESVAVHLLAVLASQAIALKVVALVGKTLFS
jgi:hypothetical protein